MTIEASARGILVFAMKVLGIGMATFAAWYFAARPISLASGWMAAKLVQAAAPIDRSKVAYREGALTVSVEPDDATMRRARLRAGIIFDLPAQALKYTFGIPFFLALLLASRPPGLAWKGVAGTAILLVAAAFGLGCDLMIQLGNLTVADGARVFELSRPVREASALGFQLGSLIFPTVGPVALWAIADPGTIRVLRSA